MSGGRYELVVGGAFGPVLRSMLDDLDIEDRPGCTRMVLHDAKDADLLALLAIVVSDDRELEQILVNRRPEVDR